VAKQVALSRARAARASLVLYNTVQFRHYSNCTATTAQGRCTDFQIEASHLRSEAIFCTLCTNKEATINTSTHYHLRFKLAPISAICVCTIVQLASIRSAVCAFATSSKAANPPRQHPLRWPADTMAQYVQDLVYALSNCMSCFPGSPKLKINNRSFKILRLLGEVGKPLQALVGTRQY
jgi:hypothetical protein